MRIGNWPLVLLAVEHAIKHPDEYEQEFYSYTTKIFSLEGIFCRTTRCLAGWMAWFSGWRQTQGDMVIRDDMEVHVERAALLSMELDPEVYGDVMAYNSRYSEELTELGHRLFDGNAAWSDILEFVHDLAKADGVTPTPLIIEEMTRLGIISDWTVH